MSRIPIVVVIALIYISPSLAADESLVSDKFKFTLATYHEDGFDGVMPNTWIGKYIQLKNENATIEGVKVEHSLESRKSALGMGIGLEVAPLFGTYGVFRTSIRNDKSTYIAIGVTIDELSMDETGVLESRNDGGFSYGFGTNNPSYNIEYMMYMDEENYEVSAIGLGLISEF
ncbi:MAG: hypothetical protein GY785_04545 [Gammaproteobacteria bacterium]|nr:hypothetical protein [Gammaproteobacteria bacterium]